MDAWFCVLSELVCFWAGWCFANLWREGIRKGKNDD